MGYHHYHDRPPRLFFIAALILSMALGLASAQLKCLATGTGDWHTSTTWTNCDSGVPGELDTAIISGSSAHVTIDGGRESYTTALTVTTGATLTNKGTRPPIPTLLLGDRLLSLALSLTPMTGYTPG
jgi:hypothetical protein